MTQLPAPTDPVPVLQVGDTVTLEIGDPAHGGFCVARWNGRVIFVRHAMPQERAVVRITDTSRRNYWHGDAIQIERAHPQRIASLWPQAGPDGVGGGELSHMSLTAQNQWKTYVLAEQFKRLAHQDVDCQVVSPPDDAQTAGMGWRTRITLIADDQGRVGMRKFHSHDIVPLDSMPLAVGQLQELAAQEQIFARKWRPGSKLSLVAPSGGDPVMFVDGKPWRRGRIDRHSMGSRVREYVDVDDRRWDYRVHALGFWQVHRSAPHILVQSVLDQLASVGDLAQATIADLYSGAGLFTLPLADAVGSRGRVLAVEADTQAVKDARRNASLYSQVVLDDSDVARALRRGSLHELSHIDAVVLDPPRSGAGKRVVADICRLSPQAVVYVACDPAALARDVNEFRQYNYHLRQLRSFNLFPATHHLESVALLTPGSP